MCPTPVRHNLDRVDEVAFSVLFATATITNATRSTRPVQDPWPGQPVAA